jgi:hypothetical protein
MSKLLKDYLLFQDGIDKVKRSAGLAWYLSAVLTVGNTLNRS